jgi:hypothetical protein
VLSFSTAVGPAVPVRLPAALAQVAWWQSAVLFLGVLVIGLAGPMRAGWHRRQAVIAVIGHPRGRTVIVLRRGRGGPARRIEAGSGPDDADDQSGPGCGRRCPAANLLHACIDTPPSKVVQSH